MRNKHLLFKEGNQALITRNILFDDLIDPSLNDTTDYNYSQQAAIITDEAYHGGADVAVYAKGDLYYY